MRVDLFDFDLPDSFIAQHPVEPRDSARLLDLTGDGFSDRIVRDLPKILREGDLLISNDTKVIPARLRGKRGEAGVEVTLHKQLSPSRWLSLARPAKKFRPGDQIVFSPSLNAEVETREGGEVGLNFNKSGPDLMMEIEASGEMPLPPYIKRHKGGDPSDGANYQTVFAEKEGAVAAPTAGLHFTPDLLQSLHDQGIRRETVTLHVGAGTFLPIKVDDTDDHEMHSEWGEVSADVATAVAETKARGGRVVSVGTTSLRILESAATSGRVEAFSGDTSIFITPGFQFNAVDMLLTNFHLPKSTLLMLVSAFSGRERMLAAYEHAKSKGYRFFSYGDCCLLRRMA